jgi:hypothetical protein
MLMAAVISVKIIDATRVNSFMGSAKYSACYYWLNKNKTPWPESASKLYQPSDRRFSAKLVPTFADKGATRSACRIPTVVFSDF